MAASTSGNFYFAHFAEFHFVSWITVSNVHFSLDYANDSSEAYIKKRTKVIEEVQRNTFKCFFALINFVDFNKLREYL